MLNILTSLMTTTLIPAQLISRLGTMWIWIFIISCRYGCHVYHRGNKLAARSRQSRPKPSWSATTPAVSHSQAISLRRLSWARFHTHRMLWICLLGPKWILRTSMQRWARAPLSHHSPNLIGTMKIQNELPLITILGTFGTPNASIELSARALRSDPYC